MHRDPPNYHYHYQMLHLLQTRRCDRAGLRLLDSAVELPDDGLQGEVEVGAAACDCPRLRLRQLLAATLHTVHQQATVTLKRQGTNEQWGWQVMTS